MILAIDTSTAACSLALVESDGRVVAARDEVIGRGHAERLVPMIGEMVAAHVPSHILVGVGPGSFTGLRVGISAAHGLALGWNVTVCGIDSLALVAAGVEMHDGPFAVAMAGGHGELFVRRFAWSGDALGALDEVANLSPADAAVRIPDALVVGSGAEALVAARGMGEARALLPSARRALALAPPLRDLAPSPLYVRAPDAVPAAA